MPKPLIVSICGPAGAGKSQVAKAVAASLGENRASRVPTDMFLVPRAGDESLNGFLARPLRWDWALLAQRLALPQGTATTTPEVDFTAFRRLSDEGGYRFVVRPVMLVDAMEPFPASDLVVLLEVPRDERVRRIVERDARWGTRVADRLEHLDVTWREASAGLRANLVMDGMLPVSQLAAKLATAIRRMGAFEKEPGS